MKAQIIEINGNRFALPAGMATKDIQALAGFLLTLQQVDYHYLTESEPGQPDRVFYLMDTPSIRLSSADIISREEADAVQAEDRARRETRKKAEQA
jgi:hypothetical protein